MKLSKDLEKELNRQLNMELAAAYQYQAMAAHFEYIGLDGFAKWMNGHASEEREHAQKFYDYILLRGGKVTLEALDAPKGNFSTILEVFNDAMDHEKAVTASIEGIYALARSLNDFGAENFLNWYVTEQEEEEDLFDTIITKLNLFKVDENTAALYEFDEDLGKSE